MITIDIKKAIIVFASALMLTACGEDYLDKQITTSQTEEIVFGSYSKAVSVAYSVYADLPQGLSQISGSAMFAAACDEAEFAVQTAAVQRMNNGAWMASNMPENPYAAYYTAMRKSFNFIEHVDNVNMDDVKDNPDQPGVYETRHKDLMQLKEEVTLLRAFYLFELIKRYGGVPLVKGKLNYGDEIVIERSSLQDCVDEIVRICDETAPNLPLEQPDAELGRLTRGVALTLKADVLLYAASDLWNDPSWAQGYAHPEFISLSQNKSRAERWKEAADAAKAVIDIESRAGYGIDTYTSLYGATAYKSKEVIFCRRADKTNSFEKTNLPIGFDYTTGGNCPSQNLVDAFMTKNGKNSEEFDWNNPEMAADPYKNRDPRLAKFIITNGTTIKERPVECWKGGRDGEGVRNCTPTGYYMNKFIHTSLDLSKSQTDIHTWIFYRLAEVYLMYAEALNECDPGNADIKTYYDKVRNRTGVKMPLMADNLSQDEVRQLIRRERQVELCFEGKRYFDIRRWMDEAALNAPLRGVKIEQSGDGFVYTPYEVEKRVFDKKMYFYPIPQSEINKLSTMDQNPGW